MHVLQTKPLGYINDPTLYVYAYFPLLVGFFCCGQPLNGRCKAFIVVNYPYVFIYLLIILRNDICNVAASKFKSACVLYLVSLNESGIWAYNYYYFSLEHTAGCCCKAIFSESIYLYDLNFSESPAAAALIINLCMIAFTIERVPYYSDFV